jgi:hypothetical protein
MKTVVFVLQQGCFSAVIDNKVCKFKGGKSMAFEAYKIEEIVKAFEKCNVFFKLGSCWDDTKLFILIDSADMSHLFEIIDGFEVKNKVAECKNFSFQIKIEEDPVNLESGIASFLDEGGGSAAASAEIDKLNKEIERKNAENDELKNEIVKKEDEICSLNKHIQTLEDEIAPKDKKIEELQKWYDEWDCYAVGNIISDGKGHIKLKKPIDTIHEIYIFSEDPIEYSKAELHLQKVLKDNWHFPTEKESEILFKLYKIPRVDEFNWSIGNSINSLFFESIDKWFIGDGKKFYRACDYGLVTDKKRRICKSDKYGKSVIFVR